MKKLEIVLVSSLAFVAATGLANAREAVIDGAGHWDALVDTVDGQPVCSVRSRMEGGGEVRVLLLDHAHLIIQNPAWGLHDGADYRITAWIDGRGFSADASAVDPQTLTVMDLSASFVGQFIHGYRMVLDFGNSRWNLDLSGSRYAVETMSFCHDAAQQYISSSW